MERNEIGGDGVIARIVLCEGTEGQIRQEDYDVVWTGAQPLIKTIWNALYTSEKNLGRNVTATALFSVFATMLARHPAHERVALLELINRQIDAINATEGDDEPANLLAGMTTMGNA